MNTHAPRNPPLAKHVAFTLIEILVVVAIIGILAALLLPAMSKALSAAHVARTINDLKQVRGFTVDAASQLGGSLPLTKGYGSVGAAVSASASPVLSTSALADLNGSLRLDAVLLSVPSPKLEKYFTPACGSQVFTPSGGSSTLDPRFNVTTNLFYNLPDSKIPAGFSYAAVSRLECTATSAGVPSASSGSNFYLDGVNSLPSGRVAFAVIKSVPGAEAYQIASSVNTAVFMDDMSGAAITAQNRGQVCYSAAVNGVTDVYVYLANF